MTTSHQWRPFADLPDNRSELTSGELDALYLVWEEQRAALSQGNIAAEFNQRLQREWSIETGIIEDLYKLDRGTTQVLIERGIDASLIPHDATDKDPVLVARILQDHVEVLEGMFAFVKEERTLTAGYTKELHAALLRHQETFTVVDQFGTVLAKPLGKGCYKTSPNNPTKPDGSIHEYCPPEQVASEMDRMVALHQEHMNKGIQPEVEAVWLHHTFTQIHPFEDGNGRVARAIATLVFLEAGWFPLVVSRGDRPKYIEALEVADQGNLSPLISLFTQIQKRSLAQAVQGASQLQQPATVDEAVAAVRASLVAKGQIIPKEWNRAKDTLKSLLEAASQRLNEVAEKLRTEIGSVRPGFVFVVDVGRGQDPISQEIATQLKYVASLGDLHQWVQLTLKTDRAVALVVSFHGLGSHFHGMLAVSAFLYGGSQPVAAVDDFFQINYKEDAGKAAARFQPWLEAAIVKGLALWRQQL